MSNAEAINNRIRDTTVQHLAIYNLLKKSEEEFSRKIADLRMELGRAILEEKHGTKIGDRVISEKKREYNPKTNKYENIAYEGIVKSALAESLTGVIYVTIATPQIVRFIFDENTRKTTNGEPDR